jgi:hypothetical protein
VWRGCGGGGWLEECVTVRRHPIFLFIVGVILVMVHKRVECAFSHVQCLGVSVCVCECCVTVCKSVCVCVSVCQCVSVCVCYVPGKSWCVLLFRDNFFYLVRNILMLVHKGLSFSLSKLVC